ncbi:MAG: glycosyltransferase family 2 protein [Acetatifactor sp.]|nr:glycosyltransferase family 2 protein [Acetatifactor sp.]
MDWGSMMVKVSVIMPVYNSESYLSVALDSVINQTLKDIEIICVDDGSTDRSIEILQSYQKRDERIVVLKQKQSYAGVARNYGMSVATGKYLSFLDSDDYFKPEMLEKAFENAEKQNADVVIFGGKCFDGDMENAISYPALLREEFIPEGIGFDNHEKIDNLMSITTPAPWNKLYLYSFIKKHQLKFQTCKRVNDAYFVELAIANADRIGVVREELIYYRTGNGNSLQGTGSESPEQFAEVFLSIQDKLQELNIYKKVERSFRNLCLANCIYNLENMKNAESFEKLFVALKTYIFKNLHIEGTLRNDYYNTYAYDLYLYIMSHSPLQYWMDKCDGEVKNAADKQYLFPFEMILKGSSIILYGGGRVGKVYYRQIEKSQYCILTAWADKKVKEYNGYSLCAPEKIDWCKCDYIVIAIESERTAKLIKKELYEDFGIPDTKIVWQSPLL